MTNQLVTIQLMHHCRSAVYFTSPYWSLGLGALVYHVVVVNLQQRTLQQQQKTKEILRDKVFSVCTMFDGLEEADLKEKLIVCVIYLTTT